MFWDWEWGFIAISVSLLLVSMFALNHRYHHDPQYRAFIRKQRKKG